VVDKIGSKVWTNYFNNKETITELLIGPKLKNCLFPTPDRLLENVETRNIFWRDLQRGSGAGNKHIFMGGLSCYYIDSCELQNFPS
jgi:hypothetical protein